MWIEDLGSKKYGFLNEAIPPYLVGPDKEFYLLCYKENDETLLYNENLNTCYKETIVNNISHKLASSCKIYPSILTLYAKLNTESSEPIKQVKIFDLQGMMVYAKDINAPNTSLTLNHLKNGFYIVVANNHKAKVLIER